MKARCLAAALLSLALASPAGAVDSLSLIRSSEPIRVAADEGEPAGARLGEDPLAPGGHRAREGKTRKKAAAELKGLADSFGRGRTRVPDVKGVCVDKKGRKVPCATIGEGASYDVRISGDCGCHEKVVQAAKDLRTEVLSRARSGEKTGSEYFDRFILFLIEQYTDAGKGQKLPQVREGTPETAGDIGSYTRGAGIVTVGPDFCGMSPSEQRKMLGHGYFHRWDDGLDGDPLPANAAAEKAAFAVMEFL